MHAFLSICSLRVRSPLPLHCSALNALMISHIMLKHTHQHAVRPEDSTS